MLKSSERERWWKGSRFRRSPTGNVNDFGKPGAGLGGVSWPLSSGQSGLRADIFQSPFPAQQDMRDGWESASSTLTFLRKMLNRHSDIEGSPQHPARGLREELAKSFIMWLAVVSRCQHRGSLLLQCTLPSADWRLEPTRVWKGAVPDSDSRRSQPQQTVDATGIWGFQRLREPIQLRGYPLFCLILELIF